MVLTKEDRIANSKTLKALEYCGQRCVKIVDCGRNIYTGETLVEAVEKWQNKQPDEVKI